MPKTSSLARKGLATVRTQNKQQNEIDVKNSIKDLKQSLVMDSNIANAYAITIGKSTTNRNKRKADPSPLKNERIKRSALGNLTNAAVGTSTDSESAAPSTSLKKDVGKVVAATTTTKTVTATTTTTKNVFAQARHAVGTFTKPAITRTTKILTRAATRHNNVAATTTTNNKKTVVKLNTLVVKRGTTNSSLVSASTLFASSSTKATATNLPTNDSTSNHKNLIVVEKEIEAKQKKRRITNEFEKTDDNTLYMSALEDVTITDSQEGKVKIVKTDSTSSSGSYTSTSSGGVGVKSLRSSLINNTSVYSTPVLSATGPPPGIDDFDKENWNDPFQVPEYAEYIFEYLKRREPVYVIDDYMERQPHLSKWMRSLLIDWMVEVQESFELNHETLYLAVKMVDLYLCKQCVTKETIQLLGAAALFIACKYDERTPPLIDDFLYICDGAYTKKELILMEIKLFKTIDYELGMPLSYRFLRRYARCAKVTMSILTLARFILEYSLMDYDIIRLSDSKVAAAALYMALRMNKMDGWSKTLEYYAGYKVLDFAHIVLLLNIGLHRKPKETINTVRTKYSHKIFHEVAKIPLLSHAEQLQGLDMNDLSNSVKLASTLSSQQFNTNTKNTSATVKTSPKQAAASTTSARARSREHVKP